MKHLILDIDAGPLGQRCARLYGTTAASIHHELVASTVSRACPLSWHLVPRFDTTDASAYQQAVDPIAVPPRASDPHC
jgi:hypothetical protein